MKLAATTVRALYIAILLPACLGSMASSTMAADLWIFSGQSNMKAIGSAAQRAVGELVEGKGHSYQTVYVAQPGKPIEAWLDEQHRDYAKLWIPLAEKIAAAKEQGDTFKGFVWYQGESNANESAGQYQQQLGKLVARIRKATATSDLPVIVVQIGSATSYSGRDWAAATVKEAQRRFASDDPHGTLVTAIDAHIGDYTVHLSKDGAEVVAERIALAADRLAYGNADARYGPRFKRAYFATDRRDGVIVEFDQVSDKLTLGDGWLSGFGASEHTSLPETLADLTDALSLGNLVDDYRYPTGGGLVAQNRLMLIFDQPLPERSRLSFAAPRNAQYGPHRRWALEFSGLRDSAGHQAEAFVLVPIEPAGDPVGNSAAKQVASLTADWDQLAVNCIGRFPEAVAKPGEIAGIERDEWRQPYWNPASAGLVPNLFDREGRVTPVHFHTGVWYMSPYFRELSDADDALMASWCKNREHGFSGLNPNGRYDLAVYLLQGPPRGSDQRPSHRTVRVAVAHVPEGKKLRDATIVAEQTLEVPASGEFNGYQIAAAENKFEGNVVLLKGVVADPHGSIVLTVQEPLAKGDQIRWSDTTLAGIQIRSAGE